jgi:hypothetical protein
MKYLVEKITLIRDNGNRGISFDTKDLTEDIEQFRSDIKIRFGVDKVLLNFQENNKKTTDQLQPVKEIYDKDELLYNE